VIVAGPSYIQQSVGIAENLSDVVDWSNVHPYPGMEHPETRGPGELKGFISRSERIFGKKPILASETGYHTAIETTKSHLPVSEGIKTRYLPRLLLWSFINGVKRTYIYELLDSFNRGLTDPESNFGLADFGGNPKASFFAVKHLLSLFRRPRSQTESNTALQFSFTGNSSDLVTATFKRDDGSHLLFTWLGILGWDQVTRTARLPVARMLVLAINPEPRTIVCHQFQDDGSVVKKQLNLVNGGFGVSISDSLTALEITI
jgi:hypothetical protein